jgi:hypothetical protein
LSFVGAAQASARRSDHQKAHSMHIFPKKPTFTVWHYAVSTAFFRRKSARNALKTRDLPHLNLLKQKS